MVFEGDAFQVIQSKGGIFELVFDLKGESVNKFTTAAIRELKTALEVIKNREDVKGLLLKSAKDGFIVGADITEFLDMFAQSQEQLIADLLSTNTIFSMLEDLPFPTLSAINGLALGGGCEIVLCTDFRVMSEDAKIGLPEVKLGIFPGFGGTVRLPRIIGADNAIEWICTGSEKKSHDALKDGAVDAVFETDKLLEGAYFILQQAAEGKLDYQQRRGRKKNPLELNNIESMMSFESAKGFVAAKAGKHYPAPVQAIKTIQKHASLERDDALAVEASGFSKMAQTSVASNLIGLFLNDQKLKKIAKNHLQKALKVNKAAVLGAGIMGGGIAYQSAYKGVPILMKDIHEDGLQLGLKEACKLLSKQVERRKITVPEMAEKLSAIRPTLAEGELNSVDVVVEAVVENLDVKRKVLQATESVIRDETVMASNTSTISITEMSKGLKRPENFCGMHFFNPVHRMPLVEVIRGQETSESTIATVVSYAKKLGKSPVVVNDCPGFLVNRVLFPYFGGFNLLLKDRVDFQKIDKVMEAFGWPMGPAYLLDVVGIDTAMHAQQVMSAGFPERMKPDYELPMQAIFESKRLGQKNNAGFYRYETDKKGKPKKIPDPSVYSLLQQYQQADETLPDDQEIIDRLMIPLCLETIRCLEEGIVDSAAEADMALVYGIGFPPFLGGALKYVDDMGLSEFVAKCERYKTLGPLYETTDNLLKMSAENTKFFGSKGK